MAPRLPTLPPADQSLEEFTRSLAAQPDADGLLIMGSGGAGALGPASDYDLLIVLADPPAGLQMFQTALGGRMAEAYLLSTARLRAIAAADPADAPAAGFEFALYSWLERGSVAFDRHGLLAAVQRRLREADWFRPPPEAARYQAWFGVNYNLAHTKRMAASPDPIYQADVDVRLHYTTFFMFCDYFVLRGLPLRGSKAGMRWLAEHDPAYLALFEAMLRAPDRGRKLELYEQLAALTVAPFGQLWAGAETVAQFEPGIVVEPAALDEALALWRRLSGGHEAGG
ncbi:MAG TPA: hypothetical protein VGE07_02375 [Herpetosiphonaceae bacterium]